jgi:hypothetical protein
MPSAAVSASAVAPDVNLSAKIESMEDLAAESAWFIEEGKSEIDDTPSVSLGRRSISPYGSKYGEDSYAFIGLRCRENKTEAVVASEELLDLMGPVRVTLRFDGDKAVTEFWNLSTTSKSAFATQPIKLIRRMLAAERLVIRLYPTGSSEITASFDLGGLSTIIGKLQDACHWG